VSPALCAVTEAEAKGVRLNLVDGKVKARFRAGAQEHLAAVLNQLRMNRTEVAELLRRRAEVPPMPPGIRLISWEPKQAPVMLERWSVVMDTRKFAFSTLEQLRSALKGKSWPAGNWSVAELVDRLKKVGMDVEVSASRD
jgi:hypothetical protein